VLDVHIRRIEHSVVQLSDDEQIVALPMVKQGIVRFQRRSLRENSRLRSPLDTLLKSGSRKKYCSSKCPPMQPSVEIIPSGRAGVESPGIDLS